jgi:CDP-glucose 4,6-dehydratase
MDKPWSNVKVLVTGASGFLGSWVCAVLYDLNAKVYGTVRNQGGTDSAYENLNVADKITKVTLDVTNRQQVIDLLNSIEPELIFHFAGQALVPAALRDPQRTFAINVVGTTNILEGCRVLDLGCSLVVCSSAHVFGNLSHEDLKENDPVSYGGPYETSKAAMELMVRCFHQTYSRQLQRIVIARLASVFGFGETKDRVIPKLVQAAKRHERMPVTTRKTKRQFLWVTDAITGLLESGSWIRRTDAVEIDQLRPELTATPTFHFAIEDYQPDKPSISIGNVARRVGRLLHGKLDLSQVPDHLENEIRIQALNCSKTKEILRWTATTTFNDGLLKMGEWCDGGNSSRAKQKLVLDEVARVTRSKSFVAAVKGHR